MFENFDVDIYNKGTYIGRGNTRDIHMDGAFISNCPCVINQYDVLDLVIILDKEEQSQVNLRGMVVRRSSDGVGVLFSYDWEEFSRLLSVMYHNVNEKFAPNVVNIKSNSS